MIYYNNAIKNCISANFNLLYWTFLFISLHFLSYHDKVHYSSKKCNFIFYDSLNFYQELLKENSYPRLKGNRKGILVKGKEFYIPILNTFPTR